MAKALRIAVFKKVWPKRKQVDAHMVHNDADSIIGIYPFPPAMIPVQQEFSLIRAMGCFPPPGLADRVTTREYLPSQNRLHS